MQKILPQVAWLLFTTIILSSLSQTDLQAQQPVNKDIKSLIDRTRPANPNAKKERRNGSTCTVNGTRSYDGTCNNLDNKDWGAVDIPFNQLLTPDYGPNGEMSGQSRKSAREISNIVFDQPPAVSVPSERGLSTFVFSFFQFIDHNITATEEGGESAPIPVPAGDPHFDPFNTGTQTISFHRSKALSGLTPRQQENRLSSWLDGVAIYGTDQATAEWLRTLEDGKLKSSTGNLLPCNTVTGDCNDAIDPNAPRMGGDVDRCGNPAKTFVAGDVRANEQPGLLAIHTLFMREHNRICDELVAAGMTNDEEIYQRARKIVGAKLQSITYNELLPALGIFLDELKTYNTTVRPDIYSIFSTAAFRLGHTMVPEKLLMLKDDCTNATGITGCGPADGSCSCNGSSVTFNGELTLLEAFFHPSLVSNIGLDPIIKGMTVQTQEKIDNKVVNSLRNFLFGPPGSGGLDLVSLNIQRGRDHGLPDYNAVRQYFLGTPAASFADITSDAALQTALETAYNSDINDVDLFTGLLSEDHLAGSSVGPTLHAILKDQFTRLRDCDRFWYNMDGQFSDAQQEEIENTTLAQLIKLNTGVQNVQQNVFFARDCASANDIAIALENTAGRENNEVKVPLTVEKFNNVFGAEVHFAFDDSELEFLGFEDFAISGGTFQVLNLGNGQTGFDWSSDQPTGGTVTDGDALVNLKFKLKGADGTKSLVTVTPVAFSSTAGSAPNFTVTASARDGLVVTKANPNQFNISGQITDPFGGPLEDITIFFQKPGNISTLHLPEGTTFYDKPNATKGEDYQLWIDSDAKPDRSKITVMDLVYTRRHIRNRKPFTSPYQYLAADADRSDHISYRDVKIMKQVMLGRRNKFPGGETYRYFSTSEMPELYYPFGINGYRFIDDLKTYKYGQHFMAVPKGHVTEMAGVQPPMYRDAPIIAAEKYNNVPQGAIVSVPVTAMDLMDVAGFQLTVEWFTGVLEYQGFVASENFPNLTEDDLGILNLSKGQLEVVWHDTTGNYQMHDQEETVLFHLLFKVLSANGSSSEVKVNSSSMPVLAVNKDAKFKNVAFKDVLIVVGNNAQGLYQNNFSMKNYPNPFSSETTIEFKLNNLEEVTIEIYDNLGRMIETNTATYAPGTHHYYFNGAKGMNGVYYAHIITKKQTASIPMLLMR